ncbi:hypothetical protein BaRGS_00007768 [Batillaria attramentaria]|uniref:Uncharacterized protein n=1 Tax=Batillaria attramentaria TaxID=370345 RepID=A0ABD0LN39_9CAEN
MACFTETSSSYQNSSVTPRVQAVNSKPGNQRQTLKFLPGFEAGLRVSRALSKQTGGGLRTTTEERWLEVQRANISNAEPPEEVLEVQRAKTSNAEPPGEVTALGQDLLHDKFQDSYVVHVQAISEECRMELGFKELQDHIDSLDRPCNTMSVTWRHPRPQLPLLGPTNPTPLFTSHLQAECSKLDTERCPIADEEGLMTYETDFVGIQNLTVSKINGASECSSENSHLPSAEKKTHTVQVSTVTYLPWP